MKFPESTCVVCGVGFPCNGSYSMVHRDCVEDLRAILLAILDDATGDIDNSKKRLWQIRSANMRKAMELLRDDR